MKTRAVYISFESEQETTRVGQDTHARATMTSGDTGRGIYIEEDGRGRRVLQPPRFFKLDTAGTIIALVSALMTSSSIFSERLVLC